MNITMKLALAAVAATLGATSALANEVVVTPSDTSWGVVPNGPTDGTATITGTQARNGNGSLELTGDRTRFATGTIFPNAGSTHIASLSDATALTFDWRIAGDSSNPYNPDYTPALRLHIFDATTNTRAELIWEGAYNNVYGAQTVPDTWYSSHSTDLFYINHPGNSGDVNAGKTIADWGAFLAPGSFVAGISVGQGSGALASYHAFADNVTFTTTNSSTTYNFEASATGAVPEPVTWAMLVGGFGVVGGTMRRRKANLSVRYS